MRSKGKIALIRGGGNGIDAAIAERFGAGGGAVALIGWGRQPLEAPARVRTCWGREGAATFARYQTSSW